MADYTARLCEAINSYDYPAVTCDFEPSRAELARPHYRGSMSIVEGHIGRLLRSGDPQDVKDGLSNVIYWGWAQTALGASRVRRFREGVAAGDARLKNFTQLVEGNGTPGLVALRKLRLPHFSQASFTTKILMFLDPGRYPVLDLRIANEFAGRGAFPPLRDLRFRRNGIPITLHNQDSYGRWACWCKDVANRVNREPTSPRTDLRAVDVERALFTLAGNPEAGPLLAVPQ